MRWIKRVSGYGGVNSGLYSPIMPSVAIIVVAALASESCIILGNPAGSNPAQ